MSIKTNNNLKFTYLLGAGASVGTIPVVKRFGDGLKEFIEFLREAQSQKTNSFQVIGNLIIDAIKLSEELNSYASFDTFAKKLYLSGKVNELIVNKRVISTYIFYCNLFKPKDTRYDLFFASILDKGTNGILIPDNVNLITWNYDRLADMSLQSILSCNSYQLNDHINLFNNYNLEVEKKSTEKVLNIVKLNGAAGAFLDHEVNIRNPNFDKVAEILNFYSNDNIAANDEFMSFSWETNNKFVVEARDVAKQIMSKTDHLIVIGYSFPTFNRQTDYELLNSLKPAAKIHLQIPEGNIKSVKQRLCALTGLPETSKRILEYMETDEFFIPYEFNNIIAPKPTYSVRVRTIG